MLIGFQQDLKVDQIFLNAVFQINLDGADSESCRYLMLWMVNSNGG